MANCATDGRRYTPAVWHLNPFQIGERAATQPEYTEGQVRDRRASARPLLPWETLAILAALGALVLFFLGSIAWRIFT